MGRSVLKRLSVLAASLACGAAAAAAAADRIYTTPNPIAELKRLFPAAAAFSPLAGEPLHFNAYAADPKANPAEKPIGVAFWTTDLVPQEHGYHGPIHILVGMDLTGVLTGVVVTYDSEPYGYFSVEPPKFAAQFKGKTHQRSVPRRRRRRRRVARVDHHQQRGARHPRQLADGGVRNCCRPRSSKE